MFYILKHKNHISAAYVLLVTLSNEKYQLVLIEKAPFFNQCNRRIVALFYNDKTGFISFASYISRGEAICRQFIQNSFHSWCLFFTALLHVCSSFLQPPDKKLKYWLKIIFQYFNFLRYSGAPSRAVAIYRFLLFPDICCITIVSFTVLNLLMCLQNYTFRSDRYKNRSCTSMDHDREKDSLYHVTGKPTLALKQ